MKSSVITVSLAALALFVPFSVIAKAAPGSCSVMGIVEGGGLYDSQNSDISLGAPTQTKGRSNWTSGFGEAAVGVNCDNLNFQADGALYGFWASKTLPGPPNEEDVSMASRQGHLGGAAFWRDPSSMALGVSGSWVSQGYDVSSTPTAALNASGTGSLLRAGAFAEFYASDSLTLAASAHYFSGSLPNGKFLSGVSVDQFGYEFAAIAKYYPTNDLAFTARADLLKSELRLNNAANFDFNGYAISLEGEYLMPDTQFSMFAGGRYADRTVTLFAPAYMNIQDTQVYLGVKYAFGGAASPSIAARDRSNTYDNTSVFLEKLPSLAGSVDNTLVNAIAAGPPPP
jgi:hypothetical protein